MKQPQEIRLYNADTLEFEGRVVMRDRDWLFQDLADQERLSILKGMPLKAMLSMLINFNIVYDVIEDSEQVS